MSDITAEKKLELIRNIREENHKNRLNLQSRESVLYGHEYCYTGEAINEAGDGTGKRTSHLGFRILFAIILFSLFIILDNTKGVWGGFSSVDIYGLLLENNIANSFDFIEEITYTLNHAE